MSHPIGESETGVLRVGFDRRLKLKLDGSKISSDGGLVPVRKLDDALGLTDLAGGTWWTREPGRQGLERPLRL